MKHRTFEEALQLPETSFAAAFEYHESIPTMRPIVDAELSGNEEIFRLIGYNDLRLMYSNHKYHADFMSTVFRLNEYELLARIAVWVYRSYHARGFSYDYFPVELQAWQRAVDGTMTPKAAAEIKRIYQWMLDKHHSFIELAESPEYITMTVPNNLQEMGRTFLALILDNDSKSCLELVVAYIHSPKALGDFYMDVVTPCLYEIGRLWEEGEISAAQEHLAMAVVSRVMSAMYSNFVIGDATKGCAVIMPSPNEQHEVGARMFSDLLEMDGWQVDFLGSQVSPDEALKALHDIRPQLLGISVVMPFHIDTAGQLIAKIRTDGILKKMKILVGGPAFKSAPNLWRATGADGYCADSREAVNLASVWWDQEVKFHEA